MTKEKQLGVWMDYSNAHIIAVDENSSSKNIESKFDHIEKFKSLHKSESLMHHKEHQLHLEYFEQISEVILKYKDVIIFGPTDAKVELLNYMKKDQHYDHIHITVQTSDKMTENEQTAYVKKYFSNNIF